MTTWIDACFVLVLLTNLRVLGGSRLVSNIWAVAFQGVVIGVLSALVTTEEAMLRPLLLAGLTIGVKGLILPYLLQRALREAQVRREVQPLVSLNLSMLFGVAALGVGTWLSSRLPLPVDQTPALAAPVALSTLFAGLFVIVARRQALTQVLGYLILENGIFVFGAVFVRTTPWLVETGVLLDVLVGVFVMGITVFNIQRTFDHIDTNRLAGLHDLDVQGPRTERHAS